MVSIIIPTYNRAHLIGETLDSIIAQTYQNWECIVVDDGSRDFTDELLEFYNEKDSRIQYHRRPKDRPKGANACRNYGFEVSKGKYVKWFDSDDLLHSDYLTAKLKILTEQNEICICNMDYFLKNRFSPLYVFQNNSSSSNLLVDYLTGKININTQAVLWKRGIIEDFSFNEDLNRAQELDFHFRILKSKKVKAVFVDKVLVSIRGHSESITGNYNKGEKQSLVSELTIRKNILMYILSTTEVQDKKNKSLVLYLHGIRSLYKKNKINLLFLELHSLEEKIEMKKTYKKWKFTLFHLILIYKITNREYRLKNHLYNLKNHICFQNP